VLLSRIMSRLTKSCRWWVWRRWRLRACRRGPVGNLLASSPGWSKIGCACLGTYTNAPGVSAKAASVEVPQLGVESRRGREHVLSFVRFFVRLLVVSRLSWFYSKRLYSRCSCPWFSCLVHALELQMPWIQHWTDGPPRSSVAQQACPPQVGRGPLTRATRPQLQAN
jgi:hypothetical protein